jgi:tRNA pseudouridine55 synthase
MIGFVLVNKPAGVSSYHFVARIKKLVGVKTKIGHAGTLDPFATGLLIIGIGREATRELGRISKMDKIYTATGLLGQVTDTLDTTGNVTEECPWQQVTEKDLHAACATLCGEYNQIPPIYSALKHQGQSLYQLARKKHYATEELEKIAEYKRRMVTVHELELTSFQSPHFSIRARVSHGTYIRVLVDDLARAVGSCATTTHLERSSIGQFSLNNSIDLAALATHEDLEQVLVTLKQVDLFC